ncbi:very short patch repair endonuclease [Chromobacterium sp. CV08]|uniref:very short patch repair endonuclease n=1 Tax=Chromobacterium sp. CV08 TaxID=3133274 RepID=UPI003DA8545E
MDKLSPEQRSTLMSRIKGSNTSPERKLRSAMWQMGLRFRLGQRIGRTRPDIVFKGARLAIFVDGCFWHSCPVHKSRPQSNQYFWDEKLARNVARDNKTTTDLESSGWTVMRFWEHEVKGDAMACALKIADALKKNRTNEHRK